MAERRNNHLDVGGTFYGDLSGAVFLGLARLNPTHRYVIVDTCADQVDQNGLPPNLEIVAPNLSAGRYAIPAPSNSFMDARIDMVVDFVDSPLLIKILKEVERCLVPHGVLSITDIVKNSPSVLSAFRHTNMAQVQILDQNQLLKSGQIISGTAQGFYENGHELFCAQFKK